MFGGKKSRKELEEQFELLNQENQLLRRKLRLVTGNNPAGTLSLSEVNVGGTMTARATAKDMGSIAGLEVGFMIVDRDMNVVKVNTKMALFLGGKREQYENAPHLSEVDRVDWAPEIFSTLLADAKLAGEDVPSEIEKAQPGLESGQDRHFLFRAVWTGGVGTVTVEDITRLKQTREFFERLVAPNIVSRLLDSEEDPFIVDKRRMTVLFGDLRSFTKFCDNVPPDNVRIVFDEFFQTCIDAIDRFEATLDKFVGDQVMALFNAPIHYPGHAYQAVRVAVEIQRQMQVMRASWFDRGLVPQELLVENPDLLKLGVGINTGEMLVGLFGANRSNQYTVLGHHVNLAARMCSKAAGDEILAGMGTLDDVKMLYEENPTAFDLPVKFRSKGSITVKGVTEAIPVASVVYDCE